MCQQTFIRTSASSSFQVIKALVPSDPLDSSNVLLEVVSGRTTGGTKDPFTVRYKKCRSCGDVVFRQYLAGKLECDLDVVPGDICQQFTREMFDMYQGFAEYKDWDFEVLNYTNAEYGESLFV